MASMGNSGYKSVFTQITDDVVSMIDLGFTIEDLRACDTIHISHVSVTNSPSTLYYWYNDLENGEAKLPLNKSDGSGTAQGHPIFPGGERMIRGTRNIVNFRIVSEEKDVNVAITLGTFGRSN
jgi:hypothetical protein